jgi:collagenase-like PrtC family protease
MKNETKNITSSKNILQQNKKMEIVAPAGGWDSLTAAINGGADAVYLGYKRFNARAFAENFDLAQLKKAVACAHANGVKVYLAANTLIKDSELPELTGFLNEYLAFCRDGIIIQDLGLFKVLTDLFPSVRIHASTQLNIHNTKSIQMLADFDFARAVLAREMTLGEVSAITTGQSLEIEVFAHGSQCYSYSGSCYFSSFTGLRSGNRGRCTQPCRMKYSIKTKGSVNNTDGLLFKDSYILSKSDLFTLNILPELAKAGISALKIEGRMKTPEYVGIITKLYRKYLDLYYNGEVGYSVSKEDIYKATQIFSRETGPGYLKEEFPKEIVSIKKSGSIGNLLGRITWIGYEKPGSANLNSSKNLKPFRPGTHSRPVAKGDVLEIWTNKGNEQIKVSDFKLLEMAGDKYIFSIDPGKKIRLNIGDRVFKFFDFNLDKEAKSLYTTGIKSRFLKTASPGDKESLTQTPAEKNKNSLSQIQEGTEPFLVSEIAAAVDKSGPSQTSAYQGLQDLKSVPVFKPLNHKKINDYFGGRYNEFINGDTANNAHSKQMYAPGSRSAGGNKANEDRTGLIVEIYDIADVEKIRNSGVQAIVINNYRQTIKEASSNLGLIKSLSINCKNNNVKLIVKLPQIVYDREFVQLESGLKILIASGLRNFSVSNPGILKSLAEIANSSSRSSNSGSSNEDSSISNTGSNSSSGSGNSGANGDVNCSSIIGNNNSSNNADISLEFCLNIFNHKTAAFYCGLGKKYPSIRIKAIGISPELGFNEIKTLTSLCLNSGISDVEFNLYGYGYYPVMISRYKLEYLDKDSNKPHSKEKYYLVDQKGYDFRVVKDYNDNLLFLNSRKICCLFDLPEVLSCGVNNLYIDTRTFEIGQVMEIIRTYRKALDLLTGGNFKELEDFLKNAGRNSLFSDYTKGHLDREVI